MRKLPTFLDGRVQVVVGDLTTQQVDVIVNAANSGLLGGGGVDGAIHHAGGPTILTACRELRRTRFPDGLPVGQAVMTTAGRLPAHWLIHTVGPIHDEHGRQAPELLASCYRESLALTVQRGLGSIAFPAISTGIYGYPREEAAVISSTTIAATLAHEPTLEHVRLVFFVGRDADLFVRHQVFPRAGGRVEPEEP